MVRRRAAALIKDQQEDENCASALTKRKCDQKCVLQENIRIFAGGQGKRVKLARTSAPALNYTDDLVQLALDRKRSHQKFD